MADPRVAKTRRALREALLALVAEKAFDDLSISEIVARAGLGYATFFRHYHDKDALLADVADALIDELLVQMMPALRLEETLAASVALCRFVDGRRTICRALLTGGAQANVRRQLLARARARAEAVALTPVEGLPTDLAIDHAVGAILGLLEWWLDHEGSFGAEGMGAIIDRLVMGPIRAGSAREPAHHHANL